MQERDKLLTDFGKAMLKDRYLLKGEDFQDLFKRVATYYSDNEAHAERLYDYLSKLWFMAATPILANGGTNRGLPISCFLNEMEDSLDSISSIWSENVGLASNGGGIGTYIGNVRSINEEIKGKGHSSGVMPFAKVIDSLTLAISQGSLRRGSAAIYMDISHPEIEEFIDIRRPTGGDLNRRCLNIHHGVTIPDAFMKALEVNGQWDLKSPATGKVISKVPAKDLWIRILNARIETGEPYLVFIDRVNEGRPEVQKKLGLKVKTSNLCSEITLPTGIDHLGNMRTAVCCLSSLNLEYYEEWENNKDFIPDIMRFLDNVLEDFIKKAPPVMKNAVYAAKRERSVGLGVMGFHSFLQSKMMPFESVMAKTWNKRIFKHIKEEADAASKMLAEEKGACPDAAEVGIMERFSNKIAIAPTASISIIAGNSSPGIEPFAANVFTQKTLSGSFAVKNKYLLALLRSKGKDNTDIWSSITTRGGSVSHLPFLSEEEKLVFKTAFEINQLWIVDHSADRTPFICQAQSCNLFFPANVSKIALHRAHWDSWKKGCKSLYYCRSVSVQRADNVTSMAQENFSHLAAEQTQSLNEEECLSCQ
jgi:ribonucleoside-diphosphate reductase alpha chain